MSHAKIMKSLENKSKEDLLKELFELQKKLKSEKAKVLAGASGENTSFIRNARRNIARIKFILKTKYNYHV